MPNLFCMISDLEKSYCSRLLVSPQGAGDLTSKDSQHIQKSPLSLIHPFLIPSSKLASNC